MTVETGGATTVAPQDSELIQLLTPEGERIEHPEYPFPDDADLKGMYRDMVLVRRMDTEAIALQRQGELGIWASLLGQEAAQIGSGRALSPIDGLPVGIKDIIETADMPTEMGSPLWAGWRTGRNLRVRGCAT